ncbi:hypothetical protein M0804_013192 [Polistes exclamans]|nr:hypothetical protein M0804_013192 [Polistes exclamans]
MGKNLRSYNAVSPKLYGLRKTNKKECNMRPVVSLKELVIKTIEKNWDELSKCITVQKKTLIELIQFCFESSNFGLTECFTNNWMDLAWVYVDDIVTAIPKDGIEVTIKTFNSVNKKIKFTIKVENNKTLLFLDLKIIRKEDGSILTDWYVKPTSSGRCLNFKLNHLISQKIGVVNGLLFRTLALSSKEFYNNNKKKIKSVLKCTLYLARQGIAFYHKYPGCNDEAESTNPHNSS